MSNILYGRTVFHVNNIQTCSQLLSFNRDDVTYHQQKLSKKTKHETELSKKRLGSSKCAKNQLLFDWVGCKHNYRALVSFKWIFVCNIRALSACLSYNLISNTQFYQNMCYKYSVPRNAWVYNPDNGSLRRWHESSTINTL